MSEKNELQEIKIEETETEKETATEEKTEKKKTPRGYIDLSIVSLKAIIGFIVFMIVYILLLVFL